jgi:hypothetical protein
LKDAQHPANRATRLALVIAASAILVFSVAGVVQAADKATICHATSGSNEFVVITIDEGASGFPHLDSNGSPLNGHEQDFLLPGEATVEDCVAAASSPTPTPSVPASVPASIPASIPASEGGQLGGTGTPAASLANTALGLPGSGPLATILFGAILIASLGALAYANVTAVRRRR